MKRETNTRRISLGAGKTLRQGAMFLGSLMAVLLMFAWAMHDDHLSQFIKRGQYLDGVVSGKDTRVESGSRGSSSTDYLVWVEYTYDGVLQSLLTSDYVSKFYWDELTIGDSVSLIYQPEQMYVSGSGEIWFQEAPILEEAFQPTLDRLRWYPVGTMFVFLLGILPTMLYFFRGRRKPHGS